MLIVENRKGRDLTVCDCCRRWEVLGESRPKHKLVHATYCDERNPPKNTETPGQIASAAKAGAITAVTSSEDEVVDLVRRGYVSMSDAMNRDF